MSKRCMGCMELYADELDLCPKCGYIEGTPAEEAVHMVPGSLLHNQYIIGKVLGYGSFGVTYLAWDGKLERKVAIKEYMPSEFSTRMPGHSCLTIFNGDKSEQFLDGMKKFVDEAKRLAKFNKESGIVSIFDSFLENDTAYIVMEYLDGETLGERLKREKAGALSKPIPEDEAVAILMPVMKSLQAVHAEGIIHRDIAPDNIFLTKSGEVKLIDFGASRYATTSHSRSLTTIVKPGYSPKEQYDSRGDQGPHTDVYALAATLYKMVTGKTPPEAMGRYAQCETKRKDSLEEPHRLVKDISEVRENAILNALNIRIEDRTPDVETFMEELNAEVPAKRKYGKIKKIDLYRWPLWLKIVIPLILAMLVTFGVLLATGVVEFASLFSDEVKIPEGVVIVPDVEEMEKDEALKTIEEAGLLPSPDGNVESEFVDAGKIVYQSPDSGIYLELNGTVSLVVSSGKGVVEVKDGVSTVPYVIWDTQEDAIAKLKQAGLAEPIIETKSDDKVAAGQVISQSKESGEKVPEGTQITIVVSTGPAAFEMPNVVGKIEKDAEKALSSRGLVVTISYAKDDDVADGKTIKQSIKAGEKVKKGDKVTLTVSSGKPVVKVPDVVGKTKNSAKSSLENSGFKVTILENYDSKVATGNVISQSPVAGTSQIKGSEIVIYVSKGKPIYSVSNVYGKTETAARGALSNFTVEVKYGGYDSKVPYGSVLSQSPAAGTSLTEGSKVTLTLSKGPDWSSWSETNPNLGSEYEVQQETRYSSRVRSTTTSSSSSMSGWTQYKSDWKWSDYGNWSDWTTNYVSSSDSRQVQTGTLYGYYAFVCPNCGYHNAYWNGGGCTNGDCGEAELKNNYKEIWLTEAHGSSGQIIDQSNKWTINASDKYNKWIGLTQDGAYQSRTGYRYRDRSKVYTYYYEKWSNWSSYSTNVVTESGDCQVRTKIYYRYRRK